jgi:hypothetical protein
MTEVLAASTVAPAQAGAQNFGTVHRLKNFLTSQLCQEMPNLL